MSLKRSLNRQDTKTAQAPLPKTPMPKVAESPPQINQQTGLTRTEAALLSPV